MIRLQCMRKLPDLEHLPITLAVLACLVMGPDFTRFVHGLWDAAGAGRWRLELVLTNESGRTDSAGRIPNLSFDLPRNLALQLYLDSDLRVPISFRLL